MRKWSVRNSHLFLVKMGNGMATLEDNLVVSYKTKHNLTIQSSKCTSLYLPKRVENLHPYKYLHVGVDSSFSHNWQNLEPVKRSLSR